MKHWQDLAWRVQDDTEKVLLERANWLRETTGAKNLCLAGGVALNCVANGKILRDGAFENVWIQPAAGDAGGAVGVATYLYHTVLGNERKWQWEHAYLGPEYKTDEIRKFLDEQAQLDFSYSFVGHTASTPPAGFMVDHTRMKLGSGEAVFLAATSAIQRWEQFRLGWLELWSPETPIKTGEVVAIRGASGAGKSTLLHLLGGLDSGDLKQTKHMEVVFVESKRSR
jgi:hypothetical protein